MTTLRQHLSRLGKKGGHARANNLTPEQRSESARMAVQARWEKRRKHLETLLGEITSGTKELHKRARANDRKSSPKKHKRTTS